MLFFPSRYPRMSGNLSGYPNYCDWLHDMKGGLQPESTLSDTTGAPGDMCLIVCASVVICSYGEVECVNL